MNPPIPPSIPSPAIRHDDTQVDLFTKVLHSLYSRGYPLSASRKAANRLLADLSSRDESLPSLSHPSYDDEDLR